MRKKVLLMFVLVLNVIGLKAQYNSEIFETTQDFFNTNKTYKYEYQYMYLLEMDIRPEHKDNALFSVNNGVLTIYDGDKITDVYTKIEFGNYPVITSNGTVYMPMCKCKDKKGNIVYLRSIEQKDFFGVSYNLYAYIENKNSHELAVLWFWSYMP